MGTDAQRVQVDVFQQIVMTSKEYKLGAVIVDSLGMLLDGVHRSRVGAKYCLVHRQQYGTPTVYFVADALDKSGRYQFDLEGQPDRFQLVKAGRGEFPALPGAKTLAPSQKLTGTWRYKLQQRITELVRDAE
jgi:hypothetical protein